MALYRGILNLGNIPKFSNSLASSLLLNMTQFPSTFLAVMNSLCFHVYLFAALKYISYNRSFGGNNIEE